MHDVESGTHLVQEILGGPLKATFNGQVRVFEKCNNFLHGTYLPTFLSSAQLPPLPADYDGMFEKIRQRDFLKYIYTSKTKILLPRDIPHDISMIYIFVQNI